ncbi:MAG: hypothetical protein LCH41_03520 [Armatimonadetes bacterium]|nr:hypothetical protein [Armatimonadota bacterium]
MKRLSSKEIKAQIKALKDQGDRPSILPESVTGKLTPKQSSKRIRKQGSN